MDRARIFAWRLVVPLLGFALAAAPWLLVRPGTPSAAGDIPPIRLYRCDSPPGDLLPPGLFHPARPARRLAPSAEQIPLVIATEFTSDTDRAGETAEAKGPALAEPDEAATPAQDGPSGSAETPAAITPSSAAVETPIAPPTAIPPVPPAATPATSPAATPAAAPQTPPQADEAALWPSEGPAERSEQLENIARQADRQIRRGFELAGRQAYFAAQAEFVTALRLLAQALDVDEQTTRHSRALAAGLTAIREVDDFVPSGTRLEADLDLPSIISNHRTPVLKDTDVGMLTALPALKCYLTFAQEQFAAAAGHEVAGSMALYALGKLHSALVKAKTFNVRAGEPKAMAFFQAALLVFPQNEMAANDLGVLLAECGHYAEARTVIEYSLAIRQQWAGWRNLAVVYQQLHLAELSQRANGQAEITRRAELARLGAPSAAGLAVRWIDPQTFAQSYADTTMAHDPPPARPPASPATPPSSTAAQQPTTAQQPTAAQRPPALLLPAAAPQAPSTARAPWASAETR